MKAWTWPSVCLFAILVAGIVLLYWRTDDPATRNTILGYFDTIVTFVAGAATGGALGAAAGFLRGRASVLRPT
jgi:hypothetical protein